MDQIHIFGMMVSHPNLAITGRASARSALMALFSEKLEGV